MGFWTAIRVMVTGGAGFYGSNVLEKLRETACAEAFVMRSCDFEQR
jgi:nucleoside-diphosphate-sugar epimerase